MSSNESPQLLAIKKRYKESLLGKAEFASEWPRELRNGNPDFNGLAAWLHKTAGSAGMYGYEDLAFRIRRAMESVDEILAQKKGGKVDSACAKQISAELCELGEAMRKLAK